ncbi:hypothetical protein, partial [Streptomyces olivaceoviridis]|uniref:hypothetical protein n=1 Tax=Streptomyces olivaceoviridis TaxID=1921 RepID=UPI00378B35D5
MSALLGGENEQVTFGRRFCDRVTQLKKQAGHRGLDDRLRAVAGGAGLVLSFASEANPSEAVHLTSTPSGTVVTESPGLPSCASSAIRWNPAWSKAWRTWVSRSDDADDTDSACPDPT